MPDENFSLVPETISNPSRGASLVDIALNMIKFMAFSITTIAVLAIIVGAILYLQSYGKDAMIERAKVTIKWAIWGMILGIMSLTIVTLIINGLSLIDNT